MKYAPVLAVLVLSACGGETATPGAMPDIRTASAVTASAAADAGVAVAGYLFAYGIDREADGAIVLTRRADGSAATYPATTLSLAFADRIVSFDDDGTASLVEGGIPHMSCCSL